MSIGRGTGMTVPAGVPLLPANRCRFMSVRDVAWRPIARFHEQNRETANDLNLVARIH